MIFYTVALPSEAGPLIEKLDMKRLSNENRYRIYAGDRCFLIITGVGGVNAMAAATYLLTRFNAQKSDLVVNVGICAVSRPEGSGTADITGRIFIARSIYNSAFGRSEYPDMIYRTPFDEADVFTIPDVYHANQKSEVKQGFPVRNAFAANRTEAPLLIEMEAAFIYEAAIRFIYSQNIIILKIVSDEGETVGITRIMINDLVEKHIAGITGFVEKLDDMKAHIEKPDDIIFLIDKIVRNLKLTTYQHNEFRKLAGYYILRGKPLRKFLEEAAETDCAKTKREGKAIYERLRGHLNEP